MRKREETASEEKRNFARKAKERGDSAEQDKKQMNRQTDRQTDGWTNEWKGRRADGQTGQRLPQTVVGREGAGAARRKIAAARCAEFKRASILILEAARGGANPGV